MLCVVHLLSLYLSIAVLQMLTCIRMNLVQEGMPIHTLPCSLEGLWILLIFFEYSHCSVVRPAFKGFGFKNRQPTWLGQEVETNEEVRKQATAVALAQEKGMYLKCASKLAS